jgi:alpha-L-fucosidase
MQPLSTTVSSGFSEGVLFVKPVKWIFSALTLGLFFFSSGIMFAGVGADGPTASESPRSIDQVWRQAGSKYDSERAALLQQVDKTIQQGPFRADWESLQKYEVPEWYRDAKFGIFIHWGVYSVPAFGSEWYPRMMYVEGSEEYKHHIATYGPQDKFGYKDFIPLFKAEKFDPAVTCPQFSFT